jgi:uncharacterized membrane protein YqjE
LDATGRINLPKAKTSECKQQLHPLLHLLKMTDLDLSSFDFYILSLTDIINGPAGFLDNHAILDRGQFYMITLALLAEIALEIGTKWPQVEKASQSSLARATSNRFRDLHLQLHIWHEDLDATTLFGSWDIGNHEAFHQSSLFQAVLHHLDRLRELLKSFTNDLNSMVDICLATGFVLRSSLLSCRGLDHVSWIGSSLRPKADRALWQEKSNRSTLPGAAAFFEYCKLCG